MFGFPSPSRWPQVPEPMTVVKLKVDGVPPAQLQLIGGQVVVVLEVVVVVVVVEVVPAHG